eukprot:513323-Prorocentrum_minimum.AAC.3
MYNYNNSPFARHLASARCGEYPSVDSPSLPVDSPALPVDSPALPVNSTRGACNSRLPLLVVPLGERVVKADVPWSAIEPQLQHETRMCPIVVLTPVEKGKQTNPNSVQ